jgi:hypothetical protein
VLGQARKTFVENYNCARSVFKEVIDGWPCQSYTFKFVSYDLIVCTGHSKMLLKYLFIYGKSKISLLTDPALFRPSNIRSPLFWPKITLILWMSIMS